MIFRLIVGGALAKPSSHKKGRVSSLMYSLTENLLPLSSGSSFKGFSSIISSSMIDCPEDIRLVLCLTDGACNDAELGKEICRALRGKVEVIGILLDPEAHTKSYLDDMFGEDRVIACNAAELPQKIGNILRAIRGL